MRNLRIARRDFPHIPPTTLPLTASAWDSAENCLICTFGPSPESATIELYRLGADEFTTSRIASWDAPCPNPELPCDKILQLQCFPDTATACLVLAGGDIVVVREQPVPGEETIEIVGSVDAGISAAQWSPDEELLALATNAGTFIYMTREFDAVTNITLTPEDIKASNHVSVGWGKRETQFQGKRAKALRDPTVPEHVDEGVLSSLDDKRISITWRGDGAYVAINTIEDEKRRMIRVYSRDGELDSVSEPVDGLEGALSWRPSGNIIAGVQRRTDRIDIVFFERNGLRHGEFRLRLNTKEQGRSGKNIALSWNTDSSVLAVALIDRVQFWTMGNYHWYLKQEIGTAQPNTDGQPLSVRWHPEKALQCTVGDGAQAQDVEFVWHIASGTNAPPHDFGTVAVIDGSTLKLTPLRLANVPPPAALHEITLGSTIRDVSVSSHTKLVAVACDGEIAVYEYLSTRKPPSAPTLLLSASWPRKDLSPRQILLDSSRRALVMGTDITTGEELLWEVRIDGDTTFCPFDREVKGASQLLLDSTERYVGVPNGSLQFYDREDFDLGRHGPLRKCPPNPVSIQVARHDETDIIITLTASGSLYADDRLLVRNCTSVVTTPAHLIFTTTNHLLKFVHLAPVDAMSLPSDEPESDERCRRIERGARLVTAMPSSYSVVLQMPRGNLETIYPRAMVLDGIRKSIDENNYRKAFLACRNQRVDMNIIYDHAPEQFIAGVETFIQQLKDPAHLDLFVSQLRNEDVTVTMYKNTSKELVQSGAATNGNATSETAQTNGFASAYQPDDNKVNRVCDAILRELEKSQESRTQNIITAHVCKSPPDLDAGLTVVGELKDVDSERAERAAEHICFLADVNQLYDNALGLYDLELALLIAQQSQKDPREYLPYMQQLQEMEPLRRQFAIDDKLGRRKKALIHLDELKAHDEFNAYLQKHELYPQALDLVKYQADRLREVMTLYADFLNSKDRYAEAGTAYDYLKNHEAAVSAFRAAHLWRESLTSAQLVPYTAEALTSLANTLVENLTELKDFTSAATITLDYLSDISGAAQLHCRAHNFAEAMRLLLLHKQADLLPTVIDPALVEASATMTELLADFKTQLAAQVPRLRELRVKKAEDPLAFYGGDSSAAAAGGIDIPDNVSLAPTDATTSAGTFMTRYTGISGTLNTQTTRKTSKNRRREERKRARGKKGSVYEEEYLVASIGRLIDRFNETQDEVQRLLSGLVRRGMRERAKAIQDLVEEVAGACKACVPEVFAFEAKKSVGAVGGGDQAEVGLNEERPQGAEGVLWDSMQEVNARREPPVVKAFERLSLVG